MSKRIGYDILHALCRLSPEPLARGLLPLIARVYHGLDAKHRLRVRNNLAVLGAHLGRDLTGVDREVFYHFACFLYEFFSHRAENYEKYAADLPLEQKVRECLGPVGAGPAIILVNHHGNWEIALKKLLAFGYPVSTVALRHKDPSIEEFFCGMRRHPGLEVSYLEEGVGPCLEALQRGRILALACERDYTGKGVAVELAGRKVFFPVGPAYLHHKTRAPVVSARIERVKLGHFNIELYPLSFGEEVYTSSLPIESLSQRMAQEVFKLIFQSPQQWITFDDFFAEKRLNSA